MKLQLKNVSKGWFSLAKHTGERLELKVNARAIIDIDEKDLNYYKQFIPLGIALEVLKEVKEEPKQEEKVVEAVQFNHIDEVIDVEVKDESINIIKPKTEYLSEDDLKDLTKAQLKEMCQALNVKFVKSATKANLIYLLLKEFGEQ